MTYHYAPIRSAEVEKFDYIYSAGQDVWEMAVLYTAGGSLGW